MRILVLSKRQYMNQDLLDDRYGRFREISIALGQKGHQVTGLCLSYKKKKEGMIMDHPVKWESINITSLKFPGLIKYIKRASQHVQASDAIWACSDSIYGIIGCALGKKYNKPVIFDLYDFFDEFLLARFPIIKQLFHWAICESDAITIFSQSYADHLEKIHQRELDIHLLEPANTDVLFRPLNKVKCRRNLNLPKRGIMVGTAGALFKSRGIDQLIDAFKQLKEKYPDLQLVLAGPVDQTINIPNDSRIHYLGPLPHDQVPFLYNSLDIAFIGANSHQSRYCYPSKTLEIMACNIPIIAMNIGDLKEIFIKHPEWLFEDGDLKSLMIALENRIIDKTTNYIKPLTWLDMANRLENIFIRLINN